MPRKSSVHYIAPSAFGITPNCNGSYNDLDVYLARDAKIKVYSKSAGIDTLNTSYQEWTLKGRNRRLADSSRPYTIYARLPKADRTKGYLVFAPKNGSAASGWTDKYAYVTVNGLSDTPGAVVSRDCWYIRMGTVSLPEDGLRTVTFDTGILGTDQYNSEWSLNPDELRRINLACTIDGRDAMPTPYVYWGKSVDLTATLMDGWEDEEVDRFDHWDIARSTGNADADRAWAREEHVLDFAGTGHIVLQHLKDGHDDFASCVSATFKVTAYGRSADGILSVVASTSVSMLAETVEKYDLSLSTSIVSYNPQTKTYSPEGGVAVRVRATDQKGDVFRITRTDFEISRLALDYAITDSDYWTPLPLDGGGTQDYAIATLPISAFAAQQSIEVRLCNAAGRELALATVAFVRDGEDSREREWIFLLSETAITFGDASSDHPKPSLIGEGEVSPQGTAHGTDTDKSQDDWVPNGWTDDSQGTSEDFPYEYGSYRDWQRPDGGEADDGHWGEFTTPRVWSHFGEDAVTYDLIPSLTVITANRAGVVTCDGISLKAFRTDGQLRSDNILPEYDYPAEGGYYLAEYSIDGGEWLECSKFEYPDGLYGYGIGRDVVSQVTESVVFRLKHSDAPDVVLKESLPVNVVKTLTEEELKDVYLSKVHDDEAMGLIGFLKGAWFGTKQWMIDALGNATLNNVTVSEILRALNAYINKVRSTNYTGDGMLDTGWQIINDYEGGNSKAVFDYLYIRKKAIFEELEIRKLSHIGGNFCLSPASGRVWRVELYDSEVGGNLLGYSEATVPYTLGGRVLSLFKDLYGRLTGQEQGRYLLGRKKMIARRLTPEEMAAAKRIRVYMFTDDGTTRTMQNWTVGAQARCQTFNIEQQMSHVSGGESDNPDVEYWTGTKVQNHFWWRLVTAVGEDYCDDGKQHAYVEFLENQQNQRTHSDVGSDIPEVGDEFGQFGHRTRSDQSNVIMIETANEDSPAMKFYHGINSWNLNGKRPIILSPTLVEMRASMFRWITSYGDETGQVTKRGLWINITVDSQNHRRCYPNDVVSHNGTMWRCIAASGSHKEDASGNWLTQAQVDAMTLEEQMTLIEVENYTIQEPGADATDWVEYTDEAIAAYIKFSEALIAVPCEKDRKASAAVNKTITAKLMVTNLEATVTSVTVDGADDYVHGSGNNIVVSIPKGTPVTNKDYIVTIEGDCNNIHYAASDKISVYAAVRGNDAYEIHVTPSQWMWNQEGANMSREEIIRAIEDGTQLTFHIQIDKVELLDDGVTMGNSCAQITVTNDGDNIPFTINLVTASDTHIGTSYNNTTGRVWVTSVPDTLESGWVDVRITYGDNANLTVRIPFYCNLLGTWREQIIGDTRVAIADRTRYLDGQYTEFHAEFVQSSSENSSRFRAITKGLGVDAGEDPSAAVIEAKTAEYVSAVDQHVMKLERTLTGTTGEKFTNTRIDTAESSIQSVQRTVENDVIHKTDFVQNANGYSLLSYQVPNESYVQGRVDGLEEKYGLAGMRVRSDGDWQHIVFYGDRLAFRKDNGNSAQLNLWPEHDEALFGNFYFTYNNAPYLDPQGPTNSLYSNWTTSLGPASPVIIRAEGQIEVKRAYGSSLDYAVKADSMQILNPSTYGLRVDGNGVKITLNGGASWSDLIDSQGGISSTIPYANVTGKPSLTIGNATKQIADGTTAFTAAEIGITSTDMATVWNSLAASDASHQIDSSHLSTALSGYINGSNIGSQSVNYAASAGSVAWGNVTGKPFNYTGQNGQPAWLWGTNDGVNYYVWDPSNFSVNYAASAGRLTGNASYTAWGQSFWSSGTPNSISGDLYLAGSNLRLLDYGNNADCYIVGYSSAGSRRIGVAVEGVSRFEFSSTSFYTNVGIYAAGAIASLSDIRYKDVLRHFALDVETIANASIIQYRWKDGEDTKMHVGGIAQEWQAFLPEAVSEDNDGRLGMDYGVIAFTEATSLARKVVEQQMEIDDLKQRLARMEEVLMKRT